MPEEKKWCPETTTVVGVTLACTKQEGHVDRVHSAPTTKPGPGGLGVVASTWTWR